MNIEFSQTQLFTNGQERLGRFLEHHPLGLHLLLQSAADPLLVQDGADSNSLTSMQTVALVLIVAAAQLSFTQVLSWCTSCPLACWRRRSSCCQGYQMMR